MLDRLAPGMPLAQTKEVKRKLAHMAAGLAGPGTIRPGVNTTLEPGSDATAVAIAIELLGNRWKVNEKRGNRDEHHYPPNMEENTDAQL